MPTDRAARKEIGKLDEHLNIIAEAQHEISRMFSASIQQLTVQQAVLTRLAVDAGSIPAEVMADSAKLEKLGEEYEATTSFVRVVQIMMDKWHIDHPDKEAQYGELPTDIKRFSVNGA